MENKFHIKIILIIFIMIILYIINYNGIEAWIRRDLEPITITEKNINYDIKKNEFKYLIYGRYENEDTVVLKIADNALALRFNSSDLYAQLEVGKSYIFTVGGFRIPILNEYPNIYSYKILTRDEHGKILINNYE